MHPWAIQGAPLAYAVPKEGQVAFQLGFAMVKGSSPTQQVGMDVINNMLLPRVVEEWCNSTYSVPLVRGVRFAPSRQKLAPYHKSAIRNQMQLDWNTIALNNATWLEEWISASRKSLAIPPTLTVPSIERPPSMLGTTSSLLDGVYEVNLADVTKRFGDTVAVDSVSLQIRRGEFFSFLGRVVAGRRLRSG